MNYNLNGKVAVITGAGGTICGEIAKSLANEGVSVAIWDISIDATRKKQDEIRSSGGRAIAIECDATEKMSVVSALKETLREYGTIDILVNGAGGSRKETTTSEDLEFFDIEPEAMEQVISLNYMSVVIPSQAVGRIFADKKSGVILNIGSIAGILPLTRSVSYSNAKAAVNNFTQWLAIHMVQNYSPKIRVNAIAPGFILTGLNRFLLVDEKTGEMTERGHEILKNTPMARYGEPHEIANAALWLVSDMASFITGTVIPVDGGFTAFPGI